MYKIMFVCHGNICRSPMAEFVFSDLAAKAGRAEEFFAASAGVSSEEIWGDVGNPVYPPVRALLAEKGISCGGERAVQLTAADGDKYDLFACMDESNLRSAQRILGGKNGKKCKKLLSFAGSGEDVSDPWYTRDFVAAYEDILRGCKGILDAVK